MVEKRCNYCGSKFDIYDEQEDFSMQRAVGYGSKYDTYIIDLRLCCSCFDSMMDHIRAKGAIDPLKGEYDI